MLRSILTGKLIVLLCVVLLSSALALAQFRTVTVQNAPGNPVPTTIQNGNPIPITVQNTNPLPVSGTVNANVVNVPTVSVNGPIPVTVGDTVNAVVSNTPTVNVNGTVPVTVGGVVNTAISNTPTVNVNGPVPVTVSGPVNTQITNTPTVNVNGTVSVAAVGPLNTQVTNTPTVNINGTVPVTGSVGITGTANVSVTNLPLGTVGPTSTTVVLVKDLNVLPLLQPFQKALSCATSAGPGSSCTASINVPAGKNLIIEYLQIVAQGNVGAMHHFELLTTAGGQALTYLYSPGNKILSDTDSDDRAVRIYADPGSPVQLTGVDSTPGPGITFNLMLSGHLVDAQ